MFQILRERSDGQGPWRARFAIWIMFISVFLAYASIMWWLSEMTIRG